MQLVEVEMELMGGRGEIGEDDSGNDGVNEYGSDGDDDNDNDGD